MPADHHSADFLIAWQRVGLGGSTADSILDGQPSEMYLEQVVIPLFKSRSLPLPTLPPTDTLDREMPILLHTEAGAFRLHVISGLSWTTQSRLLQVELLAVLEIMSQWVVQRIVYSNAQIP